MLIMKYSLLANNNCFEFGGFQEEKQKAYRREKRKDRKRKADDSGELNINVDADMAAIMGFSGFGTTKK